MDRTPDVFETIVWRGLTASPDGTLTSAMGEFEWTKGDWTRAVCSKRHTPPGESCTCGLYSTESWEQLHDLGYHWFDVSGAVVVPDALVWVIAKLVLKGKIIPSSNGVVRAEMAYPRKIYVPGQHWHLIKPIRDAYGCDAGLIDRFSGARK